jgi:hypothetical protein
MEKVQLTDNQKKSIKDAWEEAHNRSMSHGDQNVICQSIGQKEGIVYMLQVLGLTLDDVGVAGLKFKTTKK